MSPIRAGGIATAVIPRMNAELEGGSYRFFERWPVPGFIWVSKCEPSAAATSDHSRDYAAFTTRISPRQRRRASICCGLPRGGLWHIGALVAVLLYRTINNNG